MTDAVDAVDAVMAIMEAAFDPQYGEAWNRRQVEDALVLSHTHALLAGPDGTQPGDGAGAAGFALTRHIAGEEELLLVAVHPAHRGRGVGMALMQRVLAEAQARGAERIFLEMRDGNSAATLYRACGFEPVGRRANYYRRGIAGPFDAVTFARQFD